MILHVHKRNFIRISKFDRMSIEKTLYLFEFYKYRAMRDYRSIRVLLPKIHLIHFKCNEENQIRGLRYLGFTAIDNPCDRTVPTYERMVRDPLHHGWLRMTIISKFEGSLKRRKDKSSTLLKLQVDYLKHFSENIQMDYVACFENLNKEVKYILSRIGLNSSFKIVGDYYRKTLIFNYQFDE